MASDVYGKWPGYPDPSLAMAPAAVDADGWPTESWSSSSAGCPANQANWTYTLTKTLPSRLTTMKNVLGNSVTTYEWTPPDAGSSAPSGWTYTVGPPDAGTGYVTGNWTTTSCQSSQPSSPSTQPVEQSPVPSSYAWAGTFTSTGPRDLVGRTAKKVNWGLITFSSPPNTYSCQSLSLTTVAAIDPTDTGDVGGIESALQLTQNGGVVPLNATPTLAALDYAKAQIASVYNSDPRRNCGRTFGVILVTDGQSNLCNPFRSTDSQGLASCNSDGSNWAQPCLTCAQQCSPDAGCPDGDSGYTCHDGWDTAGPNGLGGNGFAPKYADLMWDPTANGLNTPIRTFVVGVSDNVSPCELNYIAYRGRSDASAPNSGFQLDPSGAPIDCRLPNASTNCTWPTGFTPPDPSHGNYYDEPTCPNTQPANGPYAFFPASATQLGDAFDSIVNVFGAGNYTTSPPATGSTSNVSVGNVGYVGFVPATDYPGWTGHLFAYDLALNHQLPSPPYHPLLWDAGAVLASSSNRNHGVNRRILTWDATTTPPTPMWIAGESAPTQGTYTDTNPATVATRLNPLCNGCGITTAVVDFIRGYDGTANPPTTMTGTPRPWVLGPIMNCTPVVIGPPEVWRQNQLADHTGFEALYGSRHQLVWVASSDGMVHAFDTLDGAEIVAVLPPDLLYKQVEMYETYLQNPTTNVTGQVRSAENHVYGVANSLRFADVYDPTAPQNYRTIIYVAEGGRVRQWGQNTSYTVGVVVRPLAVNGHIYKCTVAGTSGGTEPTWPTDGSPVTDGQVTWQDIGLIGTGLHAVDVTHVYPGRSNVTLPPPFIGSTPTPTPTSVATNTPVPCGTETPTPTPVPACTARPTDTPTPTPNPAPAGTATPTPVPTVQPVVSADNGYSSAQPVTPLWSWSQGGFYGSGGSNVNPLPQLGQAWSIPAIGGWVDPVTHTTMFELSVGAGYNETADGVTAYAFHLNALDGTKRGTGQYTLTGSSAHERVRNQAFADSVMFQTTAPYYRPDNVVSQSVQVDLNGNIWTMDPTSTGSSATQMMSVGAGQPIYFPAAVVGYPGDSTPTWDLYAFGTGSFYEISSNVTGANAFGGSSPCQFYPQVEIAARPINTATPVPAPIVETLYGLHAGNYCLGRRTQLVAPPLILTGNKTGVPPQAVFLVYDPDDRCFGTTSIIVVNYGNSGYSCGGSSSTGNVPVNLVGTGGYSPTITVYDAGPGASGGLALAGPEVYVSKSAAGAGGQSYLVTVPNLTIPQGGPGNNISWWRELE